MNSSLLQIRDEFGKNSDSQCSTCNYSTIEKSKKLEMVIDFANKNTLAYQKYMKSLQLNLSIPIGINNISNNRNMGLKNPNCRFSFYVCIGLCTTSSSGILAAACVYLCACGFCGVTPPGC